MQAPKIVTRYLPAGMNLTPPGDLFEDDAFHCKTPKNKSKAKTRKVQNTSDVNLSEKKIVGLGRKEFTDKWFSENTFQESPKQDDIQNDNSADNIKEDNFSISPPKTICKNTSIELDGVDVAGNVNSIYNVNIANIELPTVNVKPKCNDEVESSKLNGGKLDFKSKVLQHIKKSKTLKNNINNVSHKQNVTNPVKTEVPNTIKSSEVRQNTTINQGQGTDLSKNWWENNTTFNEITCQSELRKGLPLLKVENTRKSKITKIVNSEVVIHGTIIPKPVRAPEDSYFNENILQSLKNLQYLSATTMQSYMWPAILRGLNAFMIGPHQCGKTLSYIPAICTFAMDIPQKYSEFSMYSGPLIIIICTDDVRCKEIYCIINSLLKEIETSIRVEMLTNMGSVEDCDIVVAVQSDLDTCLKSQRITLKKLCHLVLEDADRLFINYTSMGNFFKILNEMQENRPHNKNIQVIMTSEKWTADIEIFMKKLYTTPIVCFQDFLQAALYSNTQFQKKKLNFAHKKFHLEDILKKRYSLNRSIVFCGENEVEELAEYLEMKGIECISILNSLLEDEIFENEDMWCSLTLGRFKVLLCTDEVFKKTKRINIANWLIHYSPPQDWMVFQQRFRSLSDNIACPLASNEDDDHMVNSCYMFMVADKKRADNEIFNDFLNQLIMLKIPHLQL